MSSAAASSLGDARQRERRQWLQVALAEGRAAEELADELKSEVDLQLHLDPGHALQLAELIGLLAESTGAPTVSALGELAVADALRLSGRYGEALSAYGRAAQSYRELGDEVGWARTRIGAAVTWRYTGLPADGLAEIEQARTILSEHSLWVRLARLEQHAGILFSQLGHFEEATSCYERALAAAQQFEPRDETQEARILGNLALLRQRLGEYERADALHEAAVAVFAQHGQAHELAQARANSAQLLSDQGHYSRALEMATSARRGFIALGHTVDAAFAGRAATHCLLALNRFEEAVALAGQTATDFGSANAELEHAGTLVLRSAGLRRLGQHAEALADLDRAQAIFSASQCWGWVAIVRAERAALLAGAGTWQEAAAEAEDAAVVLFERGLVVDGAHTTLVRATALRALGATDDARAAVERVLEVVQGRGVPWLEYQAWRLAGELAESEGRADDAVDAFTTAIGALEQVQGRILTEARATFLADKLDVYEAAVGLCLERADDARAFEFVERAKSRALVDALAGRLDIRIRPRSAAEEALADELTRLRRRHEQLSAQASGVHIPATQQLDPVSDPPDFPGDELESCERRIGVVLDELRLSTVADLERVSLLQGRTYPLPLDDETLLVEYFTIGPDLCVFTRSSGEITGVRVARARAQVERLVGQLELALAAAASVRASADRLAGTERTARGLLARLYDVLVGPVAPRLVGVRRLVFVPHGALHRVPFAALYDGTRYLVEQFEIAHGPSASALAFCRRPMAEETHRALVVAHSDDGALPGALSEARLVASLFDAECLLEAEATRPRVSAQARGVDVLHLATHGQARLDAPLFSHLRLADGHMTALDCFELELDCALVTLSACESGQANIAPGDEPIGLPRALLYAGARSVLQTLWRVDDESMPHLMEQFYTCLRDGQGRAEALRAAQLELLRNGGGRAHPFFWAPLVLVGDWGPVWHMQKEL